VLLVNPEKGRNFGIRLRNMINNLSCVLPGEMVTVTNVSDCGLKPKLMELGLVAGKSLKVLFRAPFGDPIAIDLGGYVLSLRLDEARFINVSKSQPS
jgi:ferrous iron transport protein A